ncbi:acid sphingomyelinase-like phosphodiesterase 3b isoform X2 [Penaeus japonicus]|nr:acid sphingomyelinase-like phosphodiesterase 3b isoform X2 [Penaeus japonicus]XP_042885096.1 acid sphingomyelinase-like phosphodiesterase 3b isoform X2 [Penaeus japonicus]
MWRYQLVCGLLLLTTATTWAKLGTFWHVSDFHLDVNYTADGDITNMCWKKTSQAAEGGSATKPGAFGSYECDAPFKLVKSAVDAMKRIHPNPDFIMWTGDDTAHVDDKFFSTQKVVDIISNITDTLKSSFPDIDVLPVLGNHDYYPKNQVPATENELQNKVADLWQTWLGDSYKEFKSGGRYSRDIPKTNVTVVALNTLLWYKSNQETEDSDGDPGKQFQWADGVLTELGKRKRHVYLMGHIPAGTFERYQQKKEGFHWYQERFNKKYIELVQNHSNIIKAQFFAHHHTDSFRLFFNASNASLPVSYMLLVPGVTPWRSSLSEETGANNPGVRLVTYETDTGLVKEVSTYYLDLAKANSDDRADWKLEYNFTTKYNLNAINPSTLYNFTQTMKSNRTLFDRYYTANTVSLENPEVCQDQCQRLHFCAITEVDYERFYKCNSASSTSGWAAWALATVGVLVLRLR